MEEGREVGGEKSAFPTNLPLETTVLVGLMHGLALVSLRGA